jgi:hypothetical protein
MNGYTKRKRKDVTPTTGKKTPTTITIHEAGSIHIDVKPAKKKLKFFEFERPVDRNQPLGSNKNPMFFSASGKAFDTYTSVKLSDLVEDGLSQVNFNCNADDFVSSSTMRIDSENDNNNIKDKTIENCIPQKKVNNTSISHKIDMNEFCTWADEKRYSDRHYSLC